MTGLKLQFLAAASMLASATVPDNGGVESWIKTLGPAGVAIVVMWYLLTKTIPAREASHQGDLEKLAAAHKEAMLTIINGHHESMKEMTVALHDLAKVAQDTRTIVETCPGRLTSKQPPIQT